MTDATDYLDDTIEQAGITRHEAATLIRLAAATVEDGWAGALSSFSTPEDVAELAQRAATGLYHTDTKGL